jgi:RimJ/RimL family protein N-acetyltransferase
MDTSGTLRTKKIDLLLVGAEEAARIAAGEPGEPDQWAEGFPREDDREPAESFLSAVGTADPGIFGMYKIVPTADGRVVGTAGFYGPPDESGQVTIGYGMVESAWGQGYGTAAVAGLIEVCCRHGGVTAVNADTEPDNAASQRVLEKNGFERVRVTSEACFFLLTLVS